MAGKEKRQKGDLAKVGWHSREGEREEGRMATPQAAHTRVGGGRVGWGRLQEA